MRTSTSAPPANMKPKGWSRKRLKKWKGRLLWPKKKLKRAKRARKKLKIWKALARSSARRPRQANSSARSADRRTVVAAAGEQVDGVLCGDARGTSHHGRCRPSAIC